ncbi:MAG: poly-beta-1,6 N-acetyl-D-glucosamine export porin PgaA [Halothiobacillus sp.]
MPRWNPILLSLFLLGALSFNIADAAEAVGLTQARQAAVALAKNGQPAAGIAQLQQLHQAHPDDTYVTADLIVLLRLNGQNAQIVALTQNLNPNDVPAYALLDWARALRDEKQFTRARDVLANQRQALGYPAQILYAMVTLEGGDPKAALAALPNRDARGLQAIDLANMAYVWRRAGNPTMGLSLCEQALKLMPDNPQAMREQVFALSDSGATTLALDKARAHPSLFAADAMNRLVADVTTVHIRDAVQERRRLDDLYRYKERDVPLAVTLKTLQETLALLKANGVALTAEPALIQRTRYDQIYVLRKLELMHQAVTEYEALPQHPATASAAELVSIPPYVRNAAADAYLYTRQPHKAASLYEQLIQANPKIDVEVYIALYYAYLDSERYTKAEQLLEQIHRVTPAWIGGKVGVVPNSERLDVDQLWAMDAAYRNQEGLGYARLSLLVDRAPHNTGLLNAKATLERWRGWPAQSLQTTLLAQAYAPMSKDTRINLADNHRDLEQFNLWGREITALNQDFPTDTSVQKSLAQWHDRSRPSIKSEYTTGKSRGNSTYANPVTGNRDAELQTRLNSAWNTDGWRAFLDQHYIWSSYNEGPLSYNRLGAGVEWRGDRKQFWTMLQNDQLTGKHIGVSAGWSQWLNDQWQYSLSGNTYSLDTPLRAKAAGLSGKSVNAKINWQQNESRSAYGALSVLAISDGNKRVDFATGITQRLLASPHHITSGGVDLFAERNSQPGGAYFNPAHSESASLRLEHQWITWRSYERSFTQYVKASAGYGWQAGFGASPVVDLFYEHKWKFSRTWDLHYGIGWGSNVYDGGRERRVYGLVGFGGVF